MPNRAQRRANARRNSQETEFRARSRQGLSDEYALQQQSIHLQDGGSAQWKPTASTGQVETENHVEAVDTETLSIKNPAPVRAPRGVRGWARLCSWVLIVVAAIAFLAVMWIPGLPLWLIITVACVFGVGVLSLFFTSGDPTRNPHLDDHGTAV